MPQSSQRFFNGRRSATKRAPVERMKGSLRQADRQWKATFEFLQVTTDQPPLEVDEKRQRKQLGQALNMSDLALKNFRKGFDEIGGMFLSFGTPGVLINCLTCTARPATSDPLCLSCAVVNQCWVTRDSFTRCCDSVCNMP